jgi:hypothetical protein
VRRRKMNKEVIYAIYDIIWGILFMFLVFTIFEYIASTFSMEVVHYILVYIFGMGTIATVEFINKYKTYEKEMKEKLKKFYGFSIIGGCIGALIIEVYWEIWHANLGNFLIIALISNILYNIYYFGIDIKIGEWWKKRNE